MTGTILVAEDEALSRKNICHVLAEEGYHVHQAGDGKEAIEAIDQIDFDLVLTDIQMPGIDGMDFLVEMKKNQPDAKVIMITGYSTVEHAVKALKLGAYNYIEKPFTPDTLIAAVREALNDSSR